MKADVDNLGDLEMAVLKYLWNQGSSDVKSGFQQVGQKRGITHNTVQSAFKRLWEKGLLERHKDGHAYVYEPRYTRKELTEMMVGELVDDIAGSEDVALEAFVSFAERAGSETLEALEELVARRRRSGEGHDA